MCGIAGFVSPRPIQRSVLQTMTRTLSHRGPDDEALWLSEAARGDGTALSGRVGLAQRRLAILDLSPSGRAPMPNDDRSLWITYNGEVFNFQSIRQELENAGFSFRTGTDTEVIVKAYEHWGRDCLQHFVGMFAFAIWDFRRRVLFAARDRLGIKPLYYLWRQGDFAFASELKAIRPYPGFEGSIDRAALAQYLRFQYVPSPSSIYESVRKLPPGHWLEVAGGQLTIQRYWDPVAIAARSVEDRPEEENLERLEALLSEAVRLRMIADVPLGAFLSGGVDSSTVVALMQESASGPVKTFSIGFREADTDESGYARAVASHLRTDHHERICTTQDALELIPLIPRYYDEPFGDSSAIPTMLVSRFAREHVTVSLSGDGGDELFWGYSRYFAHASLKRLLGLPAWIRQAASAITPLLPRGRLRSAASLLKGDPEADQYLRWVEFFQSEAITRLLGQPAEVPDLYRDALRRLDSGRRDAVSVLDLVSYLPEDILTKVDRASMAFSLEARVPLLDHRVVEFALTVPFSQKYRNGRGKQLLRRVLYRRVPRQLIERPKMGFAIPLGKWLRGELSGSLRDVLSPENVVRAGLLEPEAVRAILRAGLSGAGSDPGGVWLLYVLHLWAAEQRNEPSLREELPVEISDSAAAQPLLA